MDAFDYDETCVDESQVIRLIRNLLPVTQPSTDDHSASVVTTSEQTKTREEAGTLLWDLSMIPALAQLMVDQVGHVTQH